MQENKIRNSNIELLRLILMAFVVLLHFNNESMGGAFVIVKDFPFENIIFRFLEAFCLCAVNCFMIVSGYFLYTNNKVKMVKVFDIFFIVIFYRLFDYICRIIFIHEVFSFKHFLNCFFPANYFAIFYVICYVFSPYIAKLFRELDKKSSDFLMMILLFVFVILPSLFDTAYDLNIFHDPGFLSTVSIQGSGGGYTIVQFVVMLCLGMWIKKSEYNPKWWKTLFVYILSCIAIFILQEKISSYNYNFVLNVTSAISIFLLFNKINIQNKTINYISKSSFSIFCIHTGAFANILWQRYFITEKHLQNGYIVAMFWCFISVCVMYFVCMIISLLFRFIFVRIRERIYKKFTIVIIE